MNISVDLGNYAVKTSEKDYFLSKVTTKGGFSSVPFIINDQEYFLEEGEFCTDYNKSSRGITLILLYYALARYKKENLFNIVVSLPVSQYKAKKDELEHLIKSNNAKTVIFEGRERDIVIDKVLVLPEGASVIYNLTETDKQKIKGKQLLIVDIGGRTTDTALFINRKIEMVKSINVGTLKIYEEIVEEVNNRYQTEFRLEDGEKILKEGLFIYGIYQDISFIKDILVRHFNTLFKELQIKYNLQLGYILLTGGGSNIFKQAFKHRLNNLLISENPIFDNAFGSLKAGEHIWLRN